MSRGKTHIDQIERDIFESLDDRLWEEYLEWCETGYVIRGMDGQPVALSTKASPKDFLVWKETMGYFTDEKEDEEIENHIAVMEKELKNRGQL